jgi:hypothetical protein
VRDTSYDAANAITQTSDGGFVVAGETNYFNSYNDFCIIKMDSTGILQWTKVVGGPNHDNAYSIIQTTDGGYVTAGVTSSFGAGSKDMYIVRLNAIGTLQWTRTVGGSFDDYAYSIIQTADGGYIVTGYTNSFVSGVDDIYIIKLNSSGLLQWSKTIGGTTHDAAYSIIRTADGGYVVAGFTWSFGAEYADMYIVKFDANNNTCGNTTTPPSISGTGGTIDSPTCIVTNPTLTITTPTPMTSTGGTPVTLCYIGIKPVSSEIPEQFSLSQNYPNPFNPATKIKFEIPKSKFETNSKTEIRIYDVLGREVATLVNEQLSPGTYEVEWDGTNFPSGVYYYQLTVSSEQLTTNFIETKKMVLLR